MSGSRSYRKGLAAEAAVRRHYEANGHETLEHRWRGKGGEIDLIFEKEGLLVFVEVKASATTEAALASLGSRQIARISSAAEEFADNVLRPLRIDLATVNGSGVVEVIENITA